MEERREDTPESDASSHTSPTDAARKEVETRERIEGLRERLYARGTGATQRGRSPLARPMDIPKDRISEQPQKIHEEAPVVERLRPVAPSVSHVEEPAPLPSRQEGRELPVVAPAIDMPKKKTSYRIKLLLGGVGFFVLALIVSSLFLMFGGNTISGDNISISVSGPLAVGGGSEIPIQVAIANQNTIPIESATLIVTYPPGTQSAKEPGKEVTSERQQLNNIDSGVIQNIPLRAIVFGEENEEKTITVSIEYRVRGSNAIFTKDAEPLRFKISSSPVVLLVDGVKKISSGQEVELTLTVGSNSPSPLTDVLVTATYPFGFDFTASSPDTSSGKNVWLIKELKPNEKKEISIKGTMTGKEQEEQIFSFSVGVPNERDRFNLASIFTSATLGVTVEDPFLGVAIAVNGNDEETAVIAPGEAASVKISFTNTLNDTLYDGVITAQLSGNALSETQIRVDEGGFYDSTENMISWEFVENKDLARIQPGQTRSVSFALEPDKETGVTPEIKLVVTAKGKRVFENQVPQELVGTVSKVIKVASDVVVQSSALYSEGPFTNTGPVPPVAESVTQYTYLLTAKGGSNDVTGAELTAIMPQYVTWLDLVSSGDDVSYDPTKRQLTWKIGDMDANEYEEAWVQVSFRPSLSQVGTTPTILETQRFKATDRFTGTLIRKEAPALTTALLNDPNAPAGSGEVQESD